MHSACQLAQMLALQFPVLSYLLADELQHSVAVRCSKI